MKKQKIYILFVMIIANVLFFANKTEAAGKSKTTTITISAAGDCTFGSDASSPSSVNFYAVYNKVHKDKSYFFKEVKHIFEDDDLSIVNFEGTLTTRTTRADKTFAFKGHPSYVNILKKAPLRLSHLPIIIAVILVQAVILIPFLLLKKPESNTLLTQK